MPDICMCQDESCGRRFTCWRYMAPPTPEWQPYFLEEVRKPDGSCDYYIQCAEDEIGEAYPVMKRSYE